MAERYVLRRRGRELVLHSLSGHLPHPRKSERVEFVRVLVVVVIVVYNTLPCEDYSALGKESAVMQSNILCSLSDHRDLVPSRKAGRSVRARVCGELGMTY